MEKKIIKLLFRISKGRRAKQDIDKCRLCFKMIKKNQSFKFIEEEYGELRQYLVHTKCLNKSCEELK